MKEFRLINMTDFVLEVSKQTTIEGDSLVKNFNKIKNYANFLKQPLKLEMFVPCDEDGNVWEYPPTKEEWEWAQKDSADAEQSFKQKEYYYEKSKEKVLFKEFESIGGIAMAKAICETFHTIEDLASKKIPLVDLQLTPIAIKQIGLENGKDI